MSKRIKKLSPSMEMYFDDYVMLIQDYCVDVSAREIFVVKEDTQDDCGVENVQSTRFIKNLRTLSNLSHDPILVHLKSNGGYWEEGMAMYDAIKLSPCKVVVLSYTHARSMTSIILQAADKRVLMPHSYFMFHLGTEYYDDRIKPIKSQYQWNRKADKIMIDIYAKRMKEKGAFSKRSHKAIVEWLKGEMDSKEDVYLTSKDAVKYGLADEVFDGNWGRLIK